MSLAVLIEPCTDAFRRSAADPARENPACENPARENPACENPSCESPSGENPSGVIDHPSGALALSSRNRRFSLPGRPGFVTWRAEGRHRLLVGGVHAPAEYRAHLLDGFLRDSAEARENVVALQVRERDVDLFRGRGFRVDAFGSSYTLDLGRFSFAGTPRMKLRNRIQRARQAGIEVVELGRDTPCTPELWSRLGQIGRAWLATKGGTELDLLVGEMGERNEVGDTRRIFVGVDNAGNPLAFITYVAAWGERPGYLHDLTRRSPDAPAGVMERINAVAITRFQSEGVRFLHFGLTPFVLRDRPPADHRLVAWLIRAIGRWGSAIYPARAQRQYKEKWAPDLVETEFIAFQEVSLGALWALLLATRAFVPPWRRRKDADKHEGEDKGKDKDKEDKEEMKGGRA